MLFFVGENIVVARSGHIDDFHSRFNPRFQIDILVKSNIRPEINKLNDLVPAADTVNSPEALNDANRVPMNIIIDKVVAVLQVLTFGDTVCRNQNINIDFRDAVKHISVF